MKNTFKMIDVGEKQITYRIAVASGEIYVGTDAFTLIRDHKLPKGNALILAEVAGIMSAKKAYEMIPLCHPMGLDYVKIITELNEDNASITVYCFASTHAKTGVEMEALSGVNGALLTIWDLTKMIEPGLRIENTRLLAKLGGKSGYWLNPSGVPEWVIETIKPSAKPILAGYKVVVLTMSDRAYNGEYEDKSGKILNDILNKFGATIIDYKIIPDEIQAIRNSVENSVKEHSPAMIICTGGTGVSKRDVTPEALYGLFDKQIPGIGELLRSDGAKYTPLSWSSRSIAGVIGETLVVTLPGNPRAAKEGMDALFPSLVPHLIRIIRGEKNDFV